METRIDEILAKFQKLSLYLDPLFVLLNPVLTIVLQLLLSGDFWQPVERVGQGEEVGEVAMVGMVGMVVTLYNRRGTACFLLDPAKGLLG